VIKQRVLEEVPGLFNTLGLLPFALGEVEIELVAHGHGAFFNNHIDTITGYGRTPEGHDRIISLVYYFFREPQAFTGGDLRLTPLPFMGGGMHRSIDLPVMQDRAIAFPSWLPHEVLPVVCPSVDFQDYRFAVNCWVLRKR
jgi:SM-20-related protein